MQGIPEFPKQAGINAYAEGWGLYSERLAREMPGTCTDPYSEYGRLIGMIRIQALRAKAEAELGDDFDIRGFHDAVLGGGAMPPTLLERRIYQWIAGEKQVG